MILTEKKLKIMYGITPAMQQCIKNACHELDTRSIKDILDSVSDIPTFTQPEVNIMLFEIGRKYERRQKC